MAQLGRGQRAGGGHLTPVFLRRKQDQAGEATCSRAHGPRGCRGRALGSPTASSPGNHLAQGHWTGPAAGTFLTALGLGTLPQAQLLETPCPRATRPVEGEAGGAEAGQPVLPDGKGPPAPAPLPACVQRPGPRGTSATTTGSTARQ